MNSAILPPAVDPQSGWSQSLATGAAGILLLHIELARSGLGAWSAVQQWANAATRHDISAHPSTGLFDGAPAVAFALHTAGRTAYAPALDALDQDIRQATDRRLAAAHDRIDRYHLPELAEFDLMSGLTGIGAYLLHRNNDLELLRGVLAYLVRLAQQIPTPHGQLPGWWTSHGPQDVQSSDWAGGHGNLGMAHGIAGPLALLSTAMRRGVTVAGQAEAIEHICAWLDLWRCGPPAQPWWPETLSQAELRSQRPKPHPPHRPSWCYGTPGLARAMQLGGLALADQRRQRFAENALAACLTDDRQLRHLADASLCHGWAGLALTVWRVAADSLNPHRLTDQLPHLLARLDRHLGDHPVREDGLLEGTAGIHLVQHTTARPNLPQSRWDACLLLDG